MSLSYLTLSELTLFADTDPDRVAQALLRRFLSGTVNDENPGTAGGADDRD
jgi:hypothetical protein